MSEIVVPNLPPPYTALGHSMGANVLLRSAHDELSPFERMVLVSPLIAIHRDLLGVSQKVARIYAEMGCISGLLQLTYAAATSSLRNWSISRSTGSPPITCAGRATRPSRKPRPSLRWARQRWAAALGAAQLRSAPASGLSQVYCRSVAGVFAAGADTVSTQAIEDFAVELKIGGMILMPGSKHEILQENDAIRQRFWAAFDAYMGVAIPRAA